MILHSTMKTVWRNCILVGSCWVRWDEEGAVSGRKAAQRSRDSSDAQLCCCSEPVSKGCSSLLVCVTEQKEKHSACQPHTHTRMHPRTHRNNNPLLAGPLQQHSCAAFLPRIAPPRPTLPNMSPQHCCFAFMIIL